MYNSAYMWRNDKNAKNILKLLIIFENYTFFQSFKKRIKKDLF